MKSTLKDYYITPGMIAEYWNEHGYLTEKGTQWNADKVTKKFRKILNEIEDILKDKKQADDSKAVDVKEMEQVDGSKVADVKEVEQADNSETVNIKCFEDLYRSENGDTGNHFIFFDTREFTEYKQNLDGASLSEYINLLENAPAYMDDYETDTFDSLQCVFELCSQSGGVSCLTDNEIEILERKLENLIPMFRDMNKAEEALDKVNPEDIKSYEDFRMLIEEYEENKKIVRDYVNKLYIKRDADKFYIKRLFVKEHYIKNGQIVYLKEWIEKWTYVIDHLISVYGELEETNLNVQDAVKVLLTWYQNEKREKTILDSNLRQELMEKINHVLEKNGKRIKDSLEQVVKRSLKEYYDKKIFSQKAFNADHIETWDIKNVAEETTKWVSGMLQYMTDELASKLDLKDGYSYVIKQAIGDLEKIYEQVIENAESLEEMEQEKENQERNREKFGEKHGTDILPYLLECIEIINPHVERLSMIPDMETL